MDILIRQELPEEYNKTEEVVERAFLNEEFSDKTEHCWFAASENQMHSFQSFL
jgi:hypothetical protein